jgi:hypothetical protein
VAYEVARQLQASNDEVNLLLLDGRAPVYDPAYLRYDADALAFCVLCRGAKQYLGFGVDVSYTETAPLSPDERLLNVMGKVIDKNGLDLVPPSVAINFFFRFQRDIKDSEVLSRNYTPASRLRGRVTLFRTTGDNDIQGVDDPLLHSRYAIDMPLGHVRSRSASSSCTHTRTRTHTERLAGINFVTTWRWWTWAATTSRWCSSPPCSRWPASCAHASPARALDLTLSHFLTPHSHTLSSPPRPAAAAAPLFIEP